MNQSILLLFVWLFACTTTHAQIITTVAGGNITGPGDGGPALDCQLNAPIGIAFDGMGNLYIADENWHRIRKVDATGIITTIAGTGIGGYSGDGGPATNAMINNPYSVAVDNVGNVYITEGEGNGRIRKISLSGIITTVAGGGAMGLGEGGPATNATLYPAGVAVDVVGNIYMTDGMNNTVRKINTAGIITTIAGGGSVLGDGGPATAAKMLQPNAIALDGWGEIYVGEFSGARVRKINRFGIITTVAGTGTAGYNGDGIMATAAKITKPLGITTDNAGNIYFSDTYNRRVRRIDASGKISTIAGDGSGPFGGDGGPATAAQFNTITGLTFDASGNLYIADMGSGRVRKVSAVTSVNDWELPAHHSITVYPNPTNGTFTINAPTQAAIPIRITDCLGREVYRQSIQPGFSILLPGHLPGGVYVVAGMVNGTPFAQQLSIVR